jgi:predicted RNA-binding Zn-ribbon protein involved in translation (DUF1610 family)
MTSPPRQVEVICPKCGFGYTDYLRDSINLSLGETWTPEEIKEVTSTTCPNCGQQVDSDALVIRALPD